MEFIIIIIVSFLASGLTLFSGFGLGTLLLPAFGLFFPIQTAVAMTAIVHFLNNLFKLFLLGKHADKKVVLAFGIPAIFSALLGAWALTGLTDMSPLVQYEWLNQSFTVMPLALIIGILMIGFAVIDLYPSLIQLNLNQKHLPLGGLLSGFFGGLSGHQGALRSAFLIKMKLSPEAFVASGVVIACFIDFSRLFIYLFDPHFFSGQMDLGMVSAATLSAFAGAWLGNRFLKKTRMNTLQMFVAVFLILFAFLLIAGII